LGGGKWGSKLKRRLPYRLVSGEGEGENPRKKIQLKEGRQSNLQVFDLPSCQKGGREKKREGKGDRKEAWGEKKGRGRGEPVSVFPYQYGFQGGERKRREEKLCRVSKKKKKEGENKTLTTWAFTTLKEGKKGENEVTYSI